MLSTESSGTTRSLPSSIACGAAAFRLDVKNAVVVPDSVMPSGVKMRFFAKSSQFWPATAGKISPATMESTVSDADALRELHAGCVAQRAHAVALREQHPAILHDGDSRSRRPERLESSGDVGVEVLLAKALPRGPGGGEERQPRGDEGDPHGDRARSTIRWIGAPRRSDPLQMRTPCSG